MMAQNMVANGVDSGALSSVALTTLWHTTLHGHGVVIARWCRAL